ncbi:ferric reductase like transmembrane component-domain-containing protein [Emericellopsis atlantica]|uniref:Ferric reductase like transmembrane component-domain-containing protein n=1 Tax=Emericellopsis atlantica TaxID=2614577 RepID=A0A9P8CNE8_9HYPO|nr:ferric reductase like transmembrane component-domain-containing protein [Emericellopsis atlantica]KAG9253709.1 ferric reductase like transmembrane component-domain-containing protein [Emericellopsis atlantica]
MRFSVILALLFSATEARAQPPDETACVSACRSSFQRVAFVDGDPHASFYGKSCQSRLNTQSLYICLDLYCGTYNVDKLNATCVEEYGEGLLPHSIVDGMDEDDIAAVTRFNETTFAFGSKVDGLLLVDEGSFKRWLDTIESLNHAHYYHSAYGWAMGYFWLVVVAIAMVSRAIDVCEARRGAFPRQGSMRRWLKRNVQTPSTLGRRCAQDYGGWATVPPRIQSLTIGAFVVLNVWCSVHGYKIVPHNIYWPTVSGQVLRYVSDRTGIISFANFPLLWLFGMRNNVVLWLTGWDFGTSNNFHRWVARVATVQAVVHSAGYTAKILQDGGWAYFASWLTRLFWCAGEMATIAMCAILGLSFYWFRRQNYERFLVLHVGLSVLVLITMLLHVSIFNGEYDALFWVPLGIWVLDRVLRLARVLLFSYTFYTQADVWYNDAADMVRIEVPLEKSWYGVRPGTYYYLSVLDDACFWESHPFTVASVTLAGDEKRPGLLETGESSPLLSAANDDGFTSGVKNVRGDFVTFLVRPYDSFTGRLKRRAEMASPKSVKLKLVVDGPYGGTLPLEKFDEVVFVVGGSGIVVPISYLEVLVASMEGKRASKVAIHWAVRQAGFATEVLQRDLLAAATSSNISLSVYHTGSDSTTRLESDPVAWYNARINATRTVEEALAAGEGSIVVVACGPARMADAARQATVKGMGRSDRRIEYFKESFQW